MHGGIAQLTVSDVVGVLSAHHAANVSKVQQSIAEAAGTELPAKGNICKVVYLVLSASMHKPSDAVHLLHATSLVHATCSLRRKLTLHGCETRPGCVVQV